MIGKLETKISTEFGWGVLLTLYQLKVKIIFHSESTQINRYEYNIPVLKYIYRKPPNITLGLYSFVSTFWWAYTWGLIFGGLIFGGLPYTV